MYYDDFQDWERNSLLPDHIKTLRSEQLQQKRRAQLRKLFIENCKLKRISINTIKN